MVVAMDAPPATALVRNSLRVNVVNLASSSHLLPFRCCAVRSVSVHDDGFRPRRFSADDTAPGNLLSDPFLRRVPPATGSVRMSRID